MEKPQRKLMKPRNKNGFSMRSITLLKLRITEQKLKKTQITRQVIKKKRVDTLLKIPKILKA